MVEGERVGEKERLKSKRKKKKPRMRYLELIEREIFYFILCCHIAILTV